MQGGLLIQILAGLFRGKLSRRIIVTIDMKKPALDGGSRLAFGVQQLGRHVNPEVETSGGGQAENLGEPLLDRTITPRCDPYAGGDTGDGVGDGIGIPKHRILGPIGGRAGAGADETQLAGGIEWIAGTEPLDSENKGVGGHALRDGEIGPTRKQGQIVGQAATASQSGQDRAWGRVKVDFATVIHRRITEGENVQKGSIRDSHGGGGNASASS